MSKPISVGDLVVIVKAPECGCTEPLGHIHRVTDIRMSRSPDCRFCGKRWPQDHASAVLDTDFITPLARLKRIPPIEELEGEKQKEDIREPA